MTGVDFSVSTLSYKFPQFLAYWPIFGDLLFVRRTTFRRERFARDASAAISRRSSSRRQNGPNRREPPPPQPRNLDGQPNFPKKFRAFPGKWQPVNFPGNSQGGLASQPGNFTGNLQNFPAAPAAFPGKFPGRSHGWRFPENSPAGISWESISLEIHFPGNFPGNAQNLPGGGFPGKCISREMPKISREISGISWKSISREILAISREISREMTAGKFGWPSGEPPVEFPGESWMGSRISREIPREMAGNSPGNMDPPSRIWSVRPILAEDDKAYPFSAG